MVAGDIVTRTAEALAPIIQSTAGKAQELTDDLGATVKKVAVMSVDAYHQVIKQQLDFSIELADAMKVDWLSELTAATPTPSAAWWRSPRMLRTTC